MPLFAGKIIAMHLLSVSEKQQQFFFSNANCIGDNYHLCLQAKKKKKEKQRRERERENILHFFSSAISVLLNSYFRSRFLKTQTFVN